MPNRDKPQITHYQGDGCADEHGKLPDQKEQDWEKEFDEKFGFKKDVYAENFKNSIKSFISAQIQKARAELIAEKIKAIEGLKCARDEQMSFRLGFMEAKEKVLSILNQKQH